MSAVKQQFRNAYSQYRAMLRELGTGAGWTGRADAMFAALGAYPEHVRGVIYDTYSNRAAIDFLTFRLTSRARIRARGGEVRL
ncbi:hypothetical protein [Lysobacter enzymogenes]|uniref:hypothetical protein n=1 Tax=Lysobacter enzymogenes TaxID=69 RepID=UPI0011161E46|nr:hypothetical protein [Lysobacter enzymogenes]UZW62732.1 hypothetical protein BV903_010755 [Lysobacter enzymogenes]